MVELKNGDVLGYVTEATYGICAFLEWSEEKRTLTVRSSSIKSGIYFITDFDPMKTAPVQDIEREIFSYLPPASWNSHPLLNKYFLNRYFD